MAGDDRMTLVREWRIARDRPDRLARVRMHAVDLLTDGALPLDLLDGLDEDERAEYIELAADSLTSLLASFLDWWVLSEAPARDGMGP